MQDLKADLREIYITSAKEIDVGAGRKAIVIFVPVPLLQNFHRIQSRVVRELEKKFSGKHVIVCAQRRILKKETRKTRVKQPRPRSRTLTHVHDAILEDLVYPTEIVGKRIRVKLDGSKTIRVYVLLVYSSPFPQSTRLPLMFCTYASAATWTRRIRRRSSTSWIPSLPCTGA